MKLRFLLCFFFACLGTNGIWASDAFTAAQWINTERCQSRSNTWLVYNKTVEISSIPSSLVARIAADSKYWMWINGKLVVFEGGLKRGPERQACYYDEVDIAPYLKSGENMIAVLLWHFGKDGFSHNNSGKAGLLFEAKSGERRGLWTNCSSLSAVPPGAPHMPSLSLKCKDHIYCIQAPRQLRAMLH